MTEGDPVALVESGKASTEVTAKQDGVLAAIDVPEREEVSPRRRLGVIGDPGQDASDVMTGVDSFDPVVDPPQVAILGIGRVRETDAGRELTLSSSFDHRVVDSADAARFLETVGAGLTAPTPLFE